MPTNTDRSDVQTSIDVEQLIAQQLDLMSGQIDLLAGQEMTAMRQETPAALMPRAAPPPGAAPPGDYLREFAARYNRAHARSKAYADQHRAYLADSRRSAGFRPAIRSMLYPIVGAAARGAHVRDIDGNDYVDLTMGFGVLLAGHAPSFIEDALAAHRATGLDLGPQSATAGDVARLIVELTSQPRVTFCNSGTEAVMTAIRLARAATRRTGIVMFSGSYHGHFDGVLALGTGVPASPGTPDGFIQDLTTLEYGSDAALAAIRAKADRLAAIVVEPVQSRDPGKQPRAFLRALREICSLSGTALIFDELLTGFRVAPGGAQEWFGVQADIATYGKIAGGGLPIGVIAGAARFLDSIDGGNWSYDDGFPEADRIFFAGTFNKNGATMVAAKAMLDHLRSGGQQLQTRLNAATSSLATRLNDVFARRGLATRVAWFGSMFRFEIATDADLFFYHLIQNGLYVWEGRTCFLSTAHTPQDIDRVVEAVERSIDELRSGGFFPSSQAHSEDGRMPAEAAG